MRVMRITTSTLGVSMSSRTIGFLAALPLIAAGRSPLSCRFSIPNRIVLVRLLPLIIGLIAIFVSHSSGASTITLHSGNGTVGSADSLVTMLVGPADVAFTAAFAPTDFAAARSGPSATITHQEAGVWKVALDSDPDAKWIRNSGHATALYAIDFTLTSFSAVSLDFDFLVDNQLGDSVNEGVFVNEFSLVGSKLLGGETAHFAQDQGFPTFDITPFVVEGTNTLYINAVDLGGAGALQFSAVVTVVPATVPEPSAIALFFAGAFGLTLKARYRG